MTEVLWSPSPGRAGSSRMMQFLELARQRTRLPLEDYDALWEWSTSEIGAFWELVAEFTGLILSKPWDRVVDDPERMPGACWFSGAELNFAENLLWRRGSGDAILFRNEEEETRRVSWDELRGTVARLQGALRRFGVRPGDRVAGFLPNLPETIAAMLAATSLGAVWSSCSPDFGIKGVLDRFGQIEPKVLFCADGYLYGGRRFDSLERVASILEDLPSLEKVVVIPYLSSSPNLTALPRAVSWDDALAGNEEAELAFPQVPFEHPLYVMYSSGTTGLPKCMVQSVGGILLQHRKEHVLHVDLQPDETIFYFTTCGWMMWNWLVTALANGSTVALFDGNPFSPDPGVLWRYARDEDFAHFGTSAKYLSALENAGYVVSGHGSLPHLRSVLSTGSPLSPESFDFVYRTIGADLQLASIAGGTDLNGCFVLGNPLLPVHRGEIQCRALGMKVEAWNDDGQTVLDDKGELVCLAPFPSMPIRFWGDDDGSRYRDAYFDRWPGVWRHGDFIEIRDDTGGIVIHGRSDATLNPGGVRIGTAEIYRLVEAFPEISDSLVIGQDWQDDVRVVLFVRLVEGRQLDDDLQERLRQAIRSGASPRHVPARILAVDDVPYTISGKKVELAVRQVVHGREVKNRDALKNPEALEFYRHRPELAD